MGFVCDFDGAGFYLTLPLVRGKVGWYGFSSRRSKRPKFKGKNDRQIKILGHRHPH